MVYVCDRVNDRIQVFTKDGKFVKEVRIAPKTLGDGSAWDIAFSKDAAQKYIYLADGANEKVYIIDRQSLEILTSFGDGGRQPGQFYARAQHRRPTRRATSTRRRPTRASASRSSSTRASRR